tara:strand:+ start:626 stop:1036 length:411 start_codon:yes stop_codon:yes gene_type:complete
MFSKCKLRIVFEFGECNNKLMTVKVNHRTLVPDNKVAIYEDEITLPTTITIQTLGKQDGVDTKVDADGNILEDMYAKVLSLSLDSFEFNEIFLHQKMQLVTEDGTTHTTCYLGFNGVVSLNLAEDNVFSQVLSLNS